jgi:hypothetical protein
LKGVISNSCFHVVWQWYRKQPEFTGWEPRLWVEIELDGTRGMCHDRRHGVGEVITNCNSPEADRSLFGVSLLSVLLLAGNIINAFSLVHSSATIV